MLEGLVGINYSEIFKKILSDKKAVETMGDFLISSVKYCPELREVLVEKILESENIEILIDERILEMSKKTDMKQKIYDKM